MTGRYRTYSRKPGLGGSQRSGFELGEGPFTPHRMYVLYGLYGWHSACNHLRRVPPSQWVLDKICISYLALRFSQGPGQKARADAGLIARIHLCGRITSSNYRDSFSFLRPRPSLQHSLTSQPTDRPTDRPTNRQTDKPTSLPPSLPTVPTSLLCFCCTRCRAAQPASISPPPLLELTSRHRPLPSRHIAFGLDKSTVVSSILLHHSPPPSRDDGRRRNTRSSSAGVME